MARFRKRNRIMPDVMVRRRREKQSCRSRDVEKDAWQSINALGTIYVMRTWRLGKCLARIRTAILTCLVISACVLCMSKDGETPQLRNLAEKHILNLNQRVWDVQQLIPGTKTVIKIRIRIRKRKCRKVKRLVSVRCFLDSATKISLVAGRKEMMTVRDSVMKEDGNCGKIELVTSNKQPSTSKKALKVVRNLEPKVVDRKKSIRKKIRRNLSATPPISCGIGDQAPDSSNTGSGDLSETTELHTSILKIGTESKVTKVACESTEIQSLAVLLKEGKVVTRDLSNHDVCSTSVGIDAGRDVPDKTSTMIMDLDHTGPDVRHLDTTEMDMKVTKIGASKREIIESSSESTDIQNSTRLLSEEQAIPPIDQDICDTSNEVVANKDVSEKLSTMNSDSDQAVHDVLQLNSKPRSHVQSAMESNKDCSESDSIKRSKSESDCGIDLVQREKLQIPSKEPLNPDINDDVDTVDANDKDATEKLPNMITDSDQTDIEVPKVGNTARKVPVQSAMETNEDCSHSESKSKSDNECGMALVDEKVCETLPVKIKEPSNHDIGATESEVETNMNVTRKLPTMMSDLVPENIRPDMGQLDTVELHMNMTKSEFRKSSCESTDSQNPTRLLNKEKAIPQIGDDTCHSGTNETAAGKDVAEKFPTMITDSVETSPEILQFGSTPRNVQSAVDTTKASWDCTQNDSVKCFKSENKYGMTLMQGDERNRLSIKSESEISKSSYESSDIQISTKLLNNEEAVPKIDQDNCDTSNGLGSKMNITEKLPTTTNLDHTVPEVAQPENTPKKECSQNYSINRSKSEHDCGIVQRQTCNTLHIPSKQLSNYSICDTSTVVEANKKVMEKVTNVKTDSDLINPDRMQPGRTPQKEQSAIDANKDFSQSDPIKYSESDNNFGASLVQGAVSNEAQIERKELLDHDGSDTGTSSTTDCNNDDTEKPPIFMTNLIDGKDESSVIDTTDETHMALGEAENMVRLHQEEKTKNQGKAICSDVQKTVFRNLNTFKIGKTKEEENLNANELKAGKKVMQNTSIIFEKQEIERVTIEESVSRELSKVVDTEQRKLVKLKREEEKRKRKIERNEMKREMKRLKKESKIDKILRDEEQKVKMSEKNLTNMEMNNIRFMQTFGLPVKYKSLNYEDENESSRSPNVSKSLTLYGFSNDEQLAAPGYGSKMIYERQDFEKRLSSTIQTGIKIAIEKQKMRGKTRKSFKEMKKTMKMPWKSLELDPATSRKVVNVSIPYNSLSEAERVELCDILETFDKEQTQHLKGFEVFWNYSIAYNPHLPNVAYNRVPEIDIDRAIKKIGLSIEEYGNRMANRMVRILNASKAQSAAIKDEIPSVAERRSRWQRIKSAVTSCFRYR